MVRYGTELVQTIDPAGTESCVVMFMYIYIVLCAFAIISVAFAFVFI